MLLQPLENILGEHYDMEIKVGKNENNAKRKRTNSGETVSQIKKKTVNNRETAWKFQDKVIKPLRRNKWLAKLPTKLRKRLIKECLEKKLRVVLNKIEDCPNINAVWIYDRKIGKYRWIDYEPTSVDRKQKNTENELNFVISDIRGNASDIFESSDAETEIMPTFDESENDLFEINDKYKPVYNNEINSATDECITIEEESIANSNYFNSNSESFEKSEWNKLCSDSIQIDLDENQMNVEEESWSNKSEDSSERKTRKPKRNNRNQTKRRKPIPKNKKATGGKKQSDNCHYLYVKNRKRKHSKLFNEILKLAPSYWRNRNYVRPIFPRKVENKKMDAKTLLTLKLKLSNLHRKIFNLKSEEDSTQDLEMEDSLGDNSEKISNDGVSRKDNESDFKEENNNVLITKGDFVPPKRKFDKKLLSTVTKDDDYSLIDQELPRFNWLEKKIKNGQIKISNKENREKKDSDLTYSKVFKNEESEEKIPEEVTDTLKESLSSEIDTTGKEISLNKTVNHVINKEVEHISEITSDESNSECALQIDEDATSNRDSEDGILEEGIYLVISNDQNGSQTETSYITQPTDLLSQAIEKSNCPISEKEFDLSTNNCLETVDSKDDHQHVCNNKSCLLSAPERIEELKTNVNSLSQVPWFKTLPDKEQDQNNIICPQDNVEHLESQNFDSNLNLNPINEIENKDNNEKLTDEQFSKLIPEVKINVDQVDLVKDNETIKSTEQDSLKVSSRVNATDNQKENQIDPNSLGNSHLYPTQRMLVNEQMNNVQTISLYVDKKLDKIPVLLDKIPVPNKPLENNISVIKEPEIPKPVNYDIPVTTCESNINFSNTTVKDPSTSQTWNFQFSTIAPCKSTESIVQKSQGNSTYVFQVNDIVPSASINQIESKTTSPISNSQKENGFTISKLLEIPNSENNRGFKENANLKQIDQEKRTEYIKTSSKEQQNVTERKDDDSIKIVYDSSMDLIKAKTSVPNSDTKFEKSKPEQTNEIIRKILTDSKNTTNQNKVVNKPLPNKQTFTTPIYKPQLIPSNPISAQSFQPPTGLENQSQFIPSVEDNRNKPQNKNIPSPGYQNISSYQPPPKSLREEVEFRKRELIYLDQLARKREKEFEKLQNIRKSKIKLLKMLENRIPQALTKDCGVMEGFVNNQPIKLMDSWNGNYINKNIKLTKTVSSVVQPLPTNPVMMNNTIPAYPSYLSTNECAQFELKNFMSSMNNKVQDTRKENSNNFRQNESNRDPAQKSIYPTTMLPFRVPATHPITATNVARVMPITYAETRVVQPKPAKIVPTSYQDPNYTMKAPINMPFAKDSRESPNAPKSCYPSYSYQDMNHMDSMFCCVPQKIAVYVSNVQSCQPVQNQPPSQQQPQQPQQQQQPPPPPPQQQSQQQVQNKEEPIKHAQNNFNNKNWSDQTHWQQTPQKIAPKPLYHTEIRVGNSNFWTPTPQSNIGLFNRNQPQKFQADVVPPHREENSADLVFVDPTKASHTCNYCKGNAIFLCSACKKAWYCGRECQRINWAQHSSVCIANRSLT